MHTPPLHLLLANRQVALLLIGAIVPIFGYVLTRYFPKASEPLKAGIHLVLAAAAGALYTALDTNVFGWNSQTLQLVLTAVAGTLLAHNLLWRPAEVNIRLKQ